MDISTGKLAAGLFKLGLGIFNESGGYQTNKQADKNRTQKGKE